MNHRVKKNGEGIMIKKEERDNVGRGMIGGWPTPPLSVDMAALCGPPYTDTSTNESDLVSISQKNSISTSRCSPEQSTAALIF